MLTIRDRKLLMQRIQDLGATEHEEIFKMLKDHGVDHMQNSNGIFVNLTCVPDEIVQQIRSFVAFCIDNKASLDEYDKRINECKYSQNYDRVARFGGELMQIQHQQVVPTAEGAVPSKAEEGGCGEGEGGCGEGEESSGTATDPPPPPPALTADQTTSNPPRVRPCFDIRRIETSNAKFAQAKKRYAKRKVPDRRNDGSDMTTSDLVPEPYAQPVLT